MRFLFRLVTTFRVPLVAVTLLGLMQCKAQSPAAGQAAAPTADGQPYTLRTGTQIVLVPTTVSIKGQLL